MAKIEALYHVGCAAADVERLARSICFEQTVEVPEHLVDERLRAEVVGRVASIEPLGPDRFAVQIAYDEALAHGQLPQLLNLVYGNASMMRSVRLVDLALPPGLLGRFPGPNLGAAGLRELVGVYGRPLLCTALKPRGAPEDRLVRIAREFALAGGDLVKDDHNLIDDTPEDFARRVARKQEAVAAANRSTGRNCLYLPNLMAPVDRLAEYVESALGEGVRGFLVAPLILGLDVVRALAAQYEGLLMMSHPSFTGTFLADPAHGIEPGLLHGTLFRLAGVDVAVFTNAGGRFQYTREECASIAVRVRAPLGDLKPGMPAPAGGMQLDRIPDLADQFGADAVLLIGGALLDHAGDDVQQATRTFLDRIRERFPERLEEPRAMPGTATSPGAAAPDRAAPAGPGDAPALAGAVERAPPADALPFADVVRHELPGADGERGSFLLRYFELAPGGRSGPERFARTYALIAVRGRGTLAIGERGYALEPFDLAWVPAGAERVLGNDDPDEPFGFFCVVDRTSG